MNINSIPNWLYSSFKKLFKNGRKPFSKQLLTIFLRGFDTFEELVEQITITNDPYAALFYTILSAYHFKRLLSELDKKNLKIAETTQQSDDQITVAALSSSTKSASLKQPIYVEDMNYFNTYPCVQDAMLERLMQNPPPMETKKPETPKEQPKDKSKEKSAKRPASGKSTKSSGSAKGGKKSKKQEEPEIDHTDQEIQTVFTNIGKAIEIAQQFGHWRHVYNCCVMLYNITSLLLRQPSLMEIIQQVLQHCDVYAKATESLTALLTHVARGGCVDHELFKRCNTAEDIQIPIEKARKSDPLSMPKANPIFQNLPWVASLVDLELSFITDMVVLNLKSEWLINLLIF